MIDYKQDTKPRHPIGVASTRTGIAQDVLRAWERRYGAVVPHRTPTGRRLNSDAVLVRLGLFRRLVEAGRRISDIAGETTGALRSLAEDDRRVISNQTGRVRIVHERLATTIVRRFMEGMRDRAGSKFRPRMVVTTPAGQRHELGAVMVARQRQMSGNMLRASGQLHR